MGLLATKRVDRVLNVNLPSPFRQQFSTPKLVIWALLLICAVAPTNVGAATPEADRAWQVILQEAAGPGNRFHTQDEATKAARDHLDKQEVALRDFARAYPDDARHYSAEIRLAAVLAAKARLTHQPPVLAEARKILSDLENDPATPRPVKADAGFARVSQSMEEVSAQVDEVSRGALLQTVRKFDADYPADRRTPNLLTELSTLYDSQPELKKKLLEEAAARTTDENVRKRVNDDLRRIALLGRPLDLRLQPWEGGSPINLASYRGRVVVLFFWASWSMPSLHELARLEQTAAQFAGQPVDFLTVSLDEDRAALASTIKVADLRWPVHCDGRGWQGELVRSLGINALPTVWVLDRKGNLLTLNARGQAPDLIQQALAQ